MDQVDVRVMADETWSRNGQDSVLSLVSLPPSPSCLVLLGKVDGEMGIGGGGGGGNFPGSVLKLKVLPCVTVSPVFSPGLYPSAVVPGGYRGGLCGFRVLRYGLVDSSSLVLAFGTH